MIEIRDANNAGDARLGCPSARIPCEGERARGATVIRAVSRGNLVTASKHARDADRVLVGLGAAVSEKESVDVAGSDLGELHAQTRANLSGHERVGVGQRCGLLLNRPDHSLVAVPDVHAHQLAIEIDEALAFRCPEINAPGPRHWDWVDRSLRGPLE